MEAHTVEKGPKSLFERLAEVFEKMAYWKELEVLGVPWRSVDERILGLREIALLRVGTLCKT